MSDKLVISIIKYIQGVPEKCPLVIENYVYVLPKFQ